MLSPIAEELAEEIRRLKHEKGFDSFTMCLMFSIYQEKQFNTKALERFEKGEIELIETHIAERLCQWLRQTEAL